MERHKVNSCWWWIQAVLVGALNMHDLFRAKVV